MTPKYCLPIISKTLIETESAIERYKNEYTYFEVWLDYLDDLNDENLTQLTQKYGEQLLLVFRRQNLESMNLTVEQRMYYIHLASGNKTLIDLDISSQLPELDATRGNGNVIASYHNYKETPSNDELQAIINTMANYNPTIYKLATKCHDPSDALRLLSLQQQLKNQGKRVIILGMGEHGYVTRIFGTLWGNEMIFAPPDTAAQSAPGQLTKSQLQIIFKELQHGRQ